jgi:hypothetical protein
MKRGARGPFSLVFPCLRKSVGNHRVIGQHPSVDDYPANSAADLIPRAGILDLTGSALINHTMDGLLGLCRPEALAMLLLAHHAALPDAV